MLKIRYLTNRLFFLLLITLLFNISWAESVPVGHESCADCHLTETPTSEQNGLLQPVVTLCISCHERGGSSDHAVGISPGAEGTGTLPLVAGKIACVTCHNTHAETRMLLRINTKELCLACHPNY